MKVRCFGGPLDGHVRSLENDLENGDIVSFRHSPLTNDGLWSRMIYQLLDDILYFRREEKVPHERC